MAPVPSTPMRHSHSAPPNQPPAPTRRSSENRIRTILPTFRLLPCPASLLPPLSPNPVSPPHPLGLFKLPLLLPTNPNKLPPHASLPTHRPHHPAPQGPTTFNPSSQSQASLPNPTPHPTPHSSHIPLPRPYSHTPRTASAHFSLQATPPPRLPAPAIHDPPPRGLGWACRCLVSTYAVGFWVLQPSDCLSS